MKNNEKIRENSDDFMAICTNGPFLGVIIAVLLHRPGGRGIVPQCEAGGKNVVCPTPAEKPHPFGKICTENTDWD